MTFWRDRISSWLGPAPAQPGMRRHSVQCASPLGLHRMSYLEWGDPHNPRVLMCVHGLTRNARDFDFLAQALSAQYRIVCPDVVGRGESDWLKSPVGYTVPQYVADMVTLIARLDVESVDWVGTSMGGLIGMALAAQEGTPIRKLVLNDVGPVITAESLRRIGEYVGRAPEFPSLEAAESYVRKVSESFGEHNAAQWRHLTEHSVQAIGNLFRLRYDPAIGDAFRSTPMITDMSLWPIYDTIKCPTLVIRGALSDLLTAETFAEMARRGPMAKVVEIPAVGHAPTLFSSEQIAVVRDFLLGGTA